MTFDPVLPPLFLAVIAVTLIALRAVALRPAAGTGRHGFLRWATTTVAMLLVLLAAARPGSGPASASEPAQRPQAGANVYFIVDRSADSSITDFGGAPRMSGIRADMKKLIDTHPGARFAVIAFASRPAVDWPLSGDAWSLTPVVEALNPYAGTTAAGTEVNAGAAANVLRYQLIAAGQQYPQAPSLVYYLGSGAANSTVPQGVFETEDVDGGAVLGYGADGPGITTLRGIADQLGLPFVQRSAGETLPQIGETANRPVAASDSSGTPHRVELYWVLTMIASLLLLGEIYLTTRDLLRARATRKVCGAVTRVPARVRMRRRLLVLSALPAIMAFVLAVKLISVVVVGDSAQRHFAAGEISALRDDVSLLRILNVAEPANAAFAAGGLAVLEGRLGDADTQFSAVLDRTDAAQSCSVRVNLELVRERQGDIDAWEARVDVARQRYRGALDVINGAPPGCFTGNTDPDPDRQAVRQDAAARVSAKIDGLGTVAPLAPPSPPPPAAPAAPSAPPNTIFDPEGLPDSRHLDLGGDPLEALRQLLRDAAG